MGIVVVMAAVVVLLGSCYWNPQSGAGKITLNLKSSSRAQVDPTIVQYARVYLYADNMNSQINLGEEVPYAESAMNASGGSVTIDRVPAGSGYRLVLTLGSKPDRATFVPGQFGTSGSFEVTANHETVVQLTTMQTVKAILGTISGLGYEPSFLGKNLVGLAITTSYGVVTATSGAAYVGSGSAGPPTSYTSMSPGSGSINSVSSTTYNSGEIWLNTTQGIKQYTNAGVTSSALLPSGGPSGSVLSSGSYGIAGALPNYAVYVLTEDGLGGIHDVNGVGTWVPVDLSGAHSGPPVLDFSLPPVTSTFGLFATKSGSFGMDVSMLTPGNNNLNYVSANAGFFTLTRNGKQLFVSAVALDSSGTKLCIGTNDGLFAGSVGGITSLIGPGGGSVDLTSTVSLISGSAGHPFRRVIYTQSYIVGVSNNLLVLYNGLNSFVVPLSAVVLGSFTGMGIIYITSSYIAISGSEGLTFIPLN